jgi:hypothetical protein
LSNDSTNQHGPDGGSHLCAFCGLEYHCVSIHQGGLGNIRIGGEGRCCPVCRERNVLDLDKLEARRRRKLYVG